MEDLDLDPTPRRGFLGKLAAGTVALAAAGFARANAATPAPSRANPPWDDTWMTRIKGKHRQVFDAMEVNSGFPLVMANIWLMSNHDAYNIAEKDLSAVVILRHSAIPMAMTDAIWSKYKLGEAFNVTDPATGKPSERNVFATAKDFAIPPFATSAVDKMTERGTIFCACNMAIMHFSGMTAEKAGVTKEVALQEWTAGLLPGVTRVPSGVLAVGRAQEHGCAYCNVT